MANNKIHVKIITPEAVVFDGEADSILAHGTNGAFGILPHHVPFMTSLEIGVTKITNNNESTFFSTLGGVLQFKNEEVIILTEMAERGQDIDKVKAEQEKEMAEARLGSAKTRDEIKQANILRAKAMAKLKAAAKLIG